MRHRGIRTMAIGALAALLANCAFAADAPAQEGRPEWRCSADSMAIPPVARPLSSSSSGGAILSFKPGEGQAIAELDVKIPASCNAVAFRLKKSPGAPLSGWVAIGESPSLCPEGADFFQAPLPQAPAEGWGQFTIPFKEFMPAFTRGGEGNGRFERAKVSSFGVMVYRQASGGSVLIDEIKFVNTRDGSGGNTRKNLLPGDTSFETGVGAWSFRNSPKGAQTDDSAGFSGGASLKLPPSEKSNIYSRFFKDGLAENTPYTLSFYAKSDKAEKVSCIVITPEWRYLASKEFPTTSEWTRFTLKIPPQEKPASFRMAFGAVTLNGNERQGSIWLDAIQLEEGETATEYEPSEPLSLAASTGEPGEIVPADPGRPLELKAIAFNPEIPKELQPLKIGCSVKDISGKEIFNETEELSIDPGAKAAKAFKALPSKETGYYSAEITVKDKDGNLLKRHMAPFVVAPPPQAAPGDKGFFGLHIEDLPYEAASKIGVKWVRVMGAQWRHAEPEAGKLKPIHIPEYKKAGFNVLCTLNIAPAPAWAQPQSKNGLPAKAEQPAAFLKRAFYLQGASCFEIQNEPDLTFKGSNADEAAALYAEILKASYPDVKKASTKLLFNVSGVGEKFADIVFANAPKCFDVAAPHTYTFPRNIGPKASQAVGPEDGKLKDNLLDWLRRVKAAGGKQELWIGELGWSLDIEAPFDGEYAMEHAETLSRTFLIARSVPEVKRMFWFTGLGALEGGRYEYGIWTLRDGLKPFPAAAAYANVASMIEGSVPLPPISDGDVKAYAYKSERGSVIAVWDSSRVEPGEGAKLKFGKDEAELRRLDGSLAPLDASGNTTIEVSSSPHFIIPAKDKFQQLAGKIAETLAKRAVGVNIGIPDTSSLSVALSNSLTSEFSGSMGICVAMNEEPQRSAGKNIPLKIPPSGSETFQIPLRPPLGKDGGKVSFEIKYPDGQATTITKSIPQLLPCARARAGNISSVNMASLPDPVVAEGKDLVLPPDPAVGWKGSEDLSVRANILWDDSNFYLFADVTDDTHCQSSFGERIWDGDSIQFAFDTMNDATPTGAYDANDCEFGIAFGSSKRPVVWKWKGTADAPAKGDMTNVCQVKVERKGTHTVYRLAIPWTELAPLKPKPGKIFGFNFIVNDDDGAGRKFWIGPAPGIGGSKRPGQFKKFVLTE